MSLKESRADTGLAKQSSFHVYSWFSLSVFFFFSGAHLCCKFPILPHPKGVLLDSDPMTENDPEEHLRRAEEYALAYF